MIEMFTWTTAHRFQDAMASQARLRFQVFVHARGLQHLHYDGLEYDEFDTPSAVYLVWRDANFAVRGLIRLLRTDRPYMLKNYWPWLVTARSLPEASDVWEMTRVCVDRTVEPELRRMILPELLSAAKEFFIKERAAGMIVWLGEPALIEGETERAFFVPTRFVRPDHHCAKYGIGGSVLLTGDALEERRNAA
jgi:N-acyl-L-homoserine lactone synthetase